MADPNAGDVRIAIPNTTGGVKVGETSTTAPTDATTALDGGFVGVGYIGEDGFTESPSTDTQDITAWGGDVVRTIQTSHSVTYAFEMIETNAQSLALYYGDDNVTATAADASNGNRLATQVKGDQLPRKSVVFEMYDGEVTERIYLPDAQVTERSEIQRAHGDAARYSVTITAYPDDSGVKAYIWSDDGQTTS